MLLANLSLVVADSQIAISSVLYNQTPRFVNFSHRRDGRILSMKELYTKVESETKFGARRTVFRGYQNWGKWTYNEIA